MAAQEARLAGVVVWSGSLPDAYRDVEKLPPLLILHGGQDATIPVSNAQQLATLCAQKKFSCDLSIYPQQSHAFSPGATTRADRQIFMFLEKVLGSN